MIGINVLKLVEDGKIEVELFMVFIGDGRKDGLVGLVEAESN